MKIDKVFEGIYSEENLYIDLIDDIFIVLTDIPNPPGEPQGYLPGKFKIVITWER
jgi:hypothetical protein